MRNYFAEINNLSDGVYVITDKGVENYADRWAYGYVVTTKPLDFKDLKDWVVIRVETTHDTHREYWLVRHVDAKQDALKLAQDFDQKSMYDMRTQEEVPV